MTIKLEIQVNAIIACGLSCSSIFDFELLLYGTSAQYAESISKKAKINVNRRGGSTG